MATVTNVVARFTADISDVQSKMGQAQAAFTAVGDAATFTSAKIAQVGESMANVGKKMTVGVTLPIAGLGAAAITAAMSFETGMAKIIGLVGIASDEVAKMGDEVVDMASRVGKSPDELASGLFVVTSAGLRGAEAMSVLKASAMAGAAGLGETNDIARAVSGALSAYGSDVLSAAAATDAIVATARAGNFETSQFAAAIGRVLPFAQQAGASFQDMGGAVALLTRVNGDAAQSVTQMQALFRAFVVPTEEAKDALDAVGLSAADLRDSIAKKGLPATLTMLDKALGGNREQLGRLLGSAEAASAAFQILGADAQTISETFGVVANSAGMTSEAFDVVAGTTQFQLSQAMAELKSTLIDVGESLLPMVQAVIDFASRWLKAFNSLPGPVKNVITVMAAMVAAIGPVLLIMGKLIVAGSMLLSMMLKLKAIQTLRATFAGLRAELALTRGSMAQTRASMGMMGTAATMAKTTVVTSFRAIVVAAKGLMAAFGPIGIAMVGITVILDKVVGDAAAADEMIAKLKDTVDATTGSLTRMSAEVMGTKLRLDLNAEDQIALAELGIGIDQAVAAIMKGGPAIEEFRAKIDSLKGVAWTEEGEELQRLLGIYENNFGGMADFATESMRIVKAETDAATAAQAANMSATVLAAIAAGNAVEPNKNLAGSLQEVTDAAGNVITEIDMMAAEYNEWLAVTGQISAVDQAAASIDNLGKASVEFGTNLMGQTPKARDFRGAVIQAFEDSAAAAASLSDHLPTQRAIFTGELIKIVNALKASGVKPKDIQEFLGAMNGLPASVADIMRAAGAAIGKADFKDPIKKAFDKSVKDGAPMTADAMARLAEGASKAAKDKLGLTLEPELGAIIKSGTTALRPTAFRNGELTGRSIGSGAAFGINQSSPIVIAAVERVMAAAKAAADAAVEAESPSRLFAETGDYMAQGVAMGWTRSAPVIYTAVRAAVPEAQEEVKGFAGKLAEAFLAAMKEASGSFASAITGLFGSIPVESPLEQLMGAEAAEKFVKNNEKAIAALAQLGTAIDTIVAKVQAAGAAMSELSDLVATPFGQASDLFESFAFGSDIDSVINDYERLIAVLREAYSVMTDASIVGPGAAAANSAALQGHIDYITELTAESVALREEYAANEAAIEALNEAYANQVSEINSRYDAMVAGLQRALSAATEAYNKENQKLEELIRERDGFLQRISDGFRSFVNNLSFETRAAGKQVITETRKIAEGITVALSREIETEGTTNIAAQLQERLTAIREFSTNIRSLMERGLDPALVQDFVSAGVSGAGDAVKQLASASQDQLNEINAVQRDLASETAGFQSWVSAQWHDAAIEQQQAAVAAAQARVDAANAAIAAAQAARQAELDAAKKAYDEQLAALQERNREIEARMNAIALEIEALINKILGTLPEQSSKAGQSAIDKMIEGFRKGFPKAMEELGVLMDQLVKSLRRTIRLDIKIGGGSQRAVDAANAAMGAAGMATGAASGVAEALSPDSDSVAGMVEMVNASTAMIRASWQDGIAPLPSVTDAVFKDMLSQSLDNGTLVIELFADLAASIFKSMLPLEDAMHELFYNMWKRALGTTYSFGMSIVQQAYQIYGAWLAVMRAMGVKVVAIPAPVVARVGVASQQELFGAATAFNFAPVPVGAFASNKSGGVTVGADAVNISISVTGSPDDIERQVKAAVDDGFRSLAREVMAS